MTNILEDAYNRLFKTDIKKVIFVYTPPKVGSTTLVTSLRISLGKSIRVIHIHDEIMLSVLTGIHDIKIADLIEYVSKKGKVVYIIDIYRNPIERRISEYFYKLNSLHFNNHEEKLIDYNLNRITKRLNDIFPYLSNEDYYFKLFKENKIPFDFKKKYLIQPFKKTTYIKLRLNDVNEWGNILTNILGEKIVIIKDCITENMTLGSLYKSFKEEYKIPLNFLEEIEKDKVFIHFCDTTERSEYMNKWVKKSCFEYNSFSRDEYKFYLNISLENQAHERIEYDHYLDNGCYCNACLTQRKSIFYKAVNNQPINERINHNKNLTQYTNRLNEVKTQIITNITKKKPKINNYMKTNLI